MDISTVIEALGALAQETRLAAFRLLVKAGPDGLPAGEIARALAIPHNTLSSHMSILARAGLVAPRRAGRSVIYSVDFSGMRDLLSFLMEDCCQGRPEVCGPAIADTLSACRPASAKGARHEAPAR